MASPNGFVLVTGGSRGIGAATARLAAEHGYDVCISYRDRADVGAGGGRRRRGDRGARARRTGRRLRGGGRARACSRRAHAELGPVTGLVNNAGVARPAVPRRGPERPSASSASSRVNVLGAFLCAREAVRRDVHGRRWPRRRDRQRLVARGGARLAGRVRRLRGVEGGGRHAHHRAGPGGGRARASASTRCDPASSTPRSTPAAASPAGSSRLARPCRWGAAGRRRGGGGRDRLAALRRGVLRHRVVPRGEWRAVKSVISLPRRLRRWHDDRTPRGCVRPLSIHDAVDAG